MLEKPGPDSIMTLQAPLSAKGLVPHQRPMRMVDRVLSAESNCSGIVETIIREDNIFLDKNGILFPEAMIELMAQAFAAVSGCLDSLSGRQGRAGYLVGVKSFEVFAGSCKGDRLLMEVHPEGGFAGFVIIKAMVRRQDQVLARAELKIWQAR